MKKLLLGALLLLSAANASAQCKELEEGMDVIMNVELPNMDVQVHKSLSMQRNPNNLAQLQSRCDIYSFTLQKKQRHEWLNDIFNLFENVGRKDPRCYAVHSMTETPDGNQQGSGQRALMIGEDQSHYVEIGKDYNNFQNVNILDAQDSTNTHRYAYALEWRENKSTGAIDMRYIVTYARIPSPNTTSKTSIINLGNGRLGNGRIENRLGNLRLGNGRLGDMFTVDSVFWDEVVVDTVLSEELTADTALYGRIFRSLSKEARQAAPKTFSLDDLIGDENTLLVFSRLKQDLQAGKNQEFNAISIYNLCKSARKYHLFEIGSTKPELEMLKRDIRTLLANDKNVTQNESAYRYLQLALAELELIK